MLPILARASSALVAAAAALDADEELLDEDDEPEEPELDVDVVDAEVEAVDELDSPALSVDVCDAVSHAATKNATAASAIRRCNMVMLPVLNSLAQWQSAVPDVALKFPLLPGQLRDMPTTGQGYSSPKRPPENNTRGSGNARSRNSRHLLTQIFDN